MLSSSRGMGRFCLRWPGLVVFAVVIAFSALLSTLVGPQLQAQQATPGWENGNVEVDRGSLDIAPGKRLSYSIRLTKQPTGDGWWVMIHVDGAVRADGEYDANGDGKIDITWVPSVGREYDRTNWDKSRDVSVYVTDDAPVGLKVTFTHEVWDHNTNCPVHNTAPVTVETVENDDNWPELSIEDATVVEGETAEFVVTLSEPPAQAATVYYQTSNGSALAPNDYTATTGTLTFPIGNTKQTISVPTIEDDLDEPNETFSVTLSSPDGAALSRGTGTGTITDDDNPTLSINDATSVDEGGTAQFLVTMSIPSTQSVTVNYQTRNGTAVAGQDFQTTSGILTFNPNTTQQTISVPTTDDATDEVDETFTVTLSGPSGATLQDSSGTGTIADNDVAMLSISDTTAAEGNPARFEVTLSPASARTVMVSYATSGGSAIEGTDYTTRLNSQNVGMASPSPPQGRPWAMAGRQVR